MPPDPASRPLRLPPADLARRALPRTRQPARAWFRVHSRSYSAIYFSRNPGHRYSHPACPHATLYLGQDAKTCVWERFGDNIFDSNYTLPKTLWDDCVISYVEVPDLQLCDLSRVLTRSAVMVDIAALMSPDLAVPQAWGLEIQQHPSQVPAVKFLSRFTNEACLALFDRPPVASRLKEKRIGPLSTFDPALEWLTENNVGLI
ncbi:MAG TPA: RES domain-containing protein [Clostridia bacterium]|nr:RES domain-containing protein [Clostridia bacterium]